MKTRLIHTDPFEVDVDDLEKEIRALSRPALHLINSPVPRFSRLGGLPNLPESEAWPQRRDGVPLHFLAQLDLPELEAGRICDYMPPKGCLFFFYDAKDQPWGGTLQECDGWKVIYSLDRNASVCQAPDNLPSLMHSEDPKEAIFPVRYLAGQPITSIPSLERMGYWFSQIENIINRGKIAEMEQREELGRRLKSEEFAIDAPWHKLGGWPDAVQFDSMERQCQMVVNDLWHYPLYDEEFTEEQFEAAMPGVADWILLLQLDTDWFLDCYDKCPRAGMCWGGEDRLYFWIRKQDLDRLDFSQVWVILQTT